MCCGLPAAPLQPRPPSLPRPARGSTLTPPTRAPPPQARTFFALIKSLGFNPLDLINGECMASLLARFDNRVVATTLGVAGLCALNWLIYGLRTRLRRAQEDHAFRQHMYTFLMITFLFYPSLSLIQFEGLVCEDYDQGRIRLLKADLSIDCDDPGYRRFVAINAIFIFFTQLIPLLYLGVLYRVRHLLHPPSDRSPQSQLRDRQQLERDEPALTPLTFLFAHYGLSSWAFEVVESYRRVAFISLLALIPDKAVTGCELGGRGGGASKGGGMGPTIGAVGRKVE